jgi:hypothetical protein
MVAALLITAGVLAVVVPAIAALIYVWFIDDGR